MLSCPSPSFAAIGQVEPARFDGNATNPRPLELLERCGAEVRVETFAIDRHSLELSQVRPSRNLVVLIALVPLELAQFDALDIALYEVCVVFRILDCDQNDVNIRPIGGLEIGQTKD